MTIKHHCADARNGQLLRKKRIDKPDKRNVRQLLRGYYFTDAFHSSSPKTQASASFGCSASSEALPALGSGFQAYS